MFSLGRGPKITKKELIKGALPSQNLPVRDSDLGKNVQKKERVLRSVVCDRPLISDVRKYCYKDFKELTSRVQKLVLKDWYVSSSDDQIRLRKFEVPYVTPRLDLRIDDSLAFTLIVFGWFLPEDHILCKCVKRSVRNITVSNLLIEIGKYEICKGHPEKSYSGLSIRHVLPVHTDQFAQTETSSPCLTSPLRLKLTLQAQRLKCRQLQAPIKEMKMEIEKKSLPEILVMIC